ncbi:MAG: PHP domain-containing protein [Deltaproteobacteria bacterium]|nr:PHP domain-containing protein [Deltaproteobacteria bacterium]
MEKLIDLHIHSTASDGSLSPEDVVAYAKGKGAAAISLTDHDTVEGLEAALSAGKTQGLEVIPGLEISAQHPGGSMHILGYYIDPSDPNLNQELRRLQKARRERNPKIINKLQSLGFPIDYDQVQAIAKGQIGRPHIAQALLKIKAVSSLEEAFQKYLTRGAPAYEEKFRFSPSESISMIIQAGGIPVLAHPFTLNYPSLRDLKRLVEKLKDDGLKGLEVLYPEHSSDQTRDYFSLVKELNLIYTGGSDFHGDLKNNVDLLSGKGDLKIPYCIVEVLKDLRAKGQSQ